MPPGGRGRRGFRPETCRIAGAEPAMAEAQQGSVAVGMQFVAHHAVFDDGLLPFVLEHAWGIPHQDSSCHPLLLDGQRRTRGDHVDHAALAGVDGCLAEPLRAFAWIGDRRPHRLDGIGESPLEGQHRAVARDAESSFAPGHFASPAGLRWRSNASSDRPSSAGIDLSTRRSRQVRRRVARISGVGHPAAPRPVRLRGAPAGGGTPSAGSARAAWRRVRPLFAHLG